MPASASSRARPSALPFAARLRRGGIAHIEDVGRCTYGSPLEFFSYRAATHRGEPDYGRHVNAIALSDEP